MAITIAFPPSGRAGHPTRLPRKFLAFGKKAPGETPLGFLVSVDEKTHRPDGKASIGGTLVPYKKKVNGTTVADPDRWAMYFRLTGVNPTQRFALVVFDATALPPDCPQGGADIKLVCDRREHIAVQQRPGQKRKEESASGHKGVDPASNTSRAADQFVVTADLPLGDYDVDLSETKLVKTGTNDLVANPDFSWPDGDGLIAVFFPAIQPDAGNNYPVVDVKVLFLSSNDTDGSVNVTVTAP